MAYDMSSALEVTMITEVETNEASTDLFALGLSHATGVGADMDYVAAHKWFNVAVMQGYREAAQRRAELASEMTSDEIAAALREARALITRH
jgi:TPR repeat protein